MSCSSPSDRAIAERPRAAALCDVGTGANCDANCGRGPNIDASSTPTGSARVSSQPTPHRSSGQGLVEYGLILILIAVVAIIALAFFGDALAAGLNFIGQIIDSAH